MVDGIVVVFGVIVFDGGVGCLVVFCRYGSCGVVVGCVWGLLGGFCDGWCGCRVDGVWYNGECYCKELAELC